MTVDSEHRALLLAVAKNLKDIGVRKAYSDWLQERDCAGWMIVANYDPMVWPIWTAPYRPVIAWNWKYNKKTEQQERWRLPWLEGEYQSERHTDRGDIRIRWILKAYAEGEVAV